MAMKLAYNYNGLHISDSVIKIFLIQFNPKKRISFNLALYASEESYKNDEILSFIDVNVSEDVDKVLSEYFSSDSMNADGANIIKNSYEYLKSLDSYKESVEV